MIEYEVDGTVYEFPDEMSPEEVTAALRSQKIIGGGDFDDVQGGGSTDTRGPAAKAFDYAGGNVDAVEAMGRDFNAEGRGAVEVGRGIAKGTRDAAQFALDASQLGSRYFTGAPPLIPDAEALQPGPDDPTGGAGSVIGQGLASAIPVGSVARGSAAAIKAALASRTAKNLGNAAVGAGKAVVKFPVIKEIVEGAQAGFTKASREAAEAVAGTDDQMKLAVQQALQTRAAEAAAKSEGDKILAQFAEQRAAREMAHQEARGASMAADETKHLRATIEDRARDAKGAVAARKAGESRARDFEADVDAGRAEARARTPQEPVSRKEAIADALKKRSAEKAAKQTTFDKKVSDSRAGGIDLGELAELGLDSKGVATVVRLQKAMSAGNIGGARAALDEVNRLLPKGKKLDLKQFMGKSK